MTQDFCHYNSDHVARLYKADDLYQLTNFHTSYNKEVCNFVLKIPKFCEHCKKEIKMNLNFDQKLQRYPYVGRIVHSQLAIRANNPYYRKSRG